MPSECSLCKISINKHRQIHEPSVTGQPVLTAILPSMKHGKVIVYAITVNLACKIWNWTINFIASILIQLIFIHIAWCQLLTLWYHKFVSLGQILNESLVSPYTCKVTALNEVSQKNQQLIIRNWDSGVPG